MQLLEHYTRLYALWRERTAGSPSFIEITVPELAAWFHCTERNAKLLIKAMQRKEWLVWQPGRGRGHRSRLSCIAVPDLLIAAYGRQLLHWGEIEEAVKLLQSPFLTVEGKGLLLQTIRQSFAFAAPDQGREEGGPRSSLRFPSYRNPGSLDPAYATRRTELHWIRQLFDTLVLYDADRQSYCPGLAHAWESDSTARRWRLYLQKRVQFHHGAAFSAEDVRFTLERLKSSEAAVHSAPYSPYRRLFAELEQIECIHDHLVEIRWKESCRQCLSLLTLTPASIVPSPLPADWHQKPVGTGPFIMSHREDRILVLKANPYYYRKPANLDQVEMWCLPEIYEQGTIKEPEEQEAGEMNFGHDWGSQAVHTPWERLECIDRGCKYVLINQTKTGPLQHPAVREQLYEVIRHKNAMLELGGNRGERADGFVKGLKQNSALLLDHCDSASGDSGSTDSASSESASYQSTSLESPPMEPGSVEPAPVEEMPVLQLVTYAGAGHERDAEWLRRELGKRNVPIHIRMIDYDALHHPDTLAEADLFLLEQPVDADEEAAMWAILASDQSRLRSCLTPDRLHRLELQLAQLSLEPLRSERLRGLIRLEQELLNDGSVIVWYRWRQLATFPPELQGVKIGPLGWVDYKDLWFKD